jgi:prepilin-type N-terminal cleavage/methylation domain-containing protein
MHRGEKGFTIVEVVVVTLVISIFVVMLIPKLVNMAAQAKAAACKGSLGSVRSALAIDYAYYAATNNGNTSWVAWANVSGVMAQGVPPNPYNNRTNVVYGFSSKGSTYDSAGWAYNQETGDFWAATATAGENSW